MRFDCSLVVIKLYVTIGFSMEVTSLAQPSPPGLILDIVIERVHFFFFFLLLLKGLCHEDMKILNKFH